MCQAINDRKHICLGDPDSGFQTLASVVQMGETIQATTVSHVLHQLNLYRRPVKRKSLLKKKKKAHMKSHLEFTQRYVGDSKVNWKKVLSSDQT